MPRQRKAAAAARARTHEAAHPSPPRCTPRSRTHRPRPPRRARSPITQDLLLDPVLACSGQVYERAAIETHLARAAAAGAPPTDPLSNAPLENENLVPVYPMRSRAAEYREATARACAGGAASEPKRGEAVRLLRRAAELALPPGAAAAAGPRAGGGSRRGGGSSTAGEALLVAAPGLSLELCRFLASHRGEAYNAVALKFFANSLMQGGYADQVRVPAELAACLA